MRPVFYLLCITFLSACANQKTLYQGEYLVIPSIEELKGWQLFQKEDDSYKSDMWQKSGERWADTFAVSIYYQKVVDLELKRKELDEPGKQHCQRFQSIEMEHPKMLGNVGQYQYWQTRCEVNGAVIARMIHLMMQGQESFYHIQKVWSFDVDEQAFLTWKGHTDDSFLCNMGASTNTCPTE